MKFSIALSVSEGVNSKIALMTKIAEEINSGISTGSYGSGLIEVVVGVICVDPQFDQFFKVRKPVYTKDKKILREDFIDVEIEKTLECSVKLNYHDFSVANEKQATTVLLLSIINCLKGVNWKKIDDFDSNRFIFDVENIANKLQ